jgi:hypothetical protein
MDDELSYTEKKFDMLRERLSLLTSALLDLHAAAGARYTTVLTRVMGSVLVAQRQREVGHGQRR